MLVKLIGDAVPIMTLNFYRIFIGFIFLLIVTPMIDKKALKIKLKDLKDFIIPGFLFAFSLSIFNIANTLVPVQNAILLSSMAPIFVLIFAYVMLKERLTKTKIITLATALVGLFVINPLQAEGGVYNLLALLDAVVYALLWVYMKKEDIKHGVDSILWISFIATIFLLPFPFIYGFGTISFGFIYILALGIVSTGLAYLLFSMGLKKSGSEIASIIKLSISPVVATLLAVLIINETLTPNIILGGAILIASGIYLETHNKALRP